MDTPDSAPLLPPGEVLFDGLPSRAVVLDELASIIGDGAVLVRQDHHTGVVLVRGRQIDGVYLLGNQERVTGDPAVAGIRALTNALVTAVRFEAHVVEVLSPLLTQGEPCYADLRLGWIDWHQLLADIEARPGTFLVEIRAGGGRGATVIVDGRHVATYSDAQDLEPEGCSMLDRLGREPTGTVSVQHLPASGGRAAAALPLVADRLALPERDHGIPVRDVLPDLKLVARERLHRSAPRLERLLEDAAEEARPLNAVMADIRQMSIRGVLPSTLAEVADQMQAVALGGGS